MRCEPSGGAWVVGLQKEHQQSHQDGGWRLDEEEPSPPREPEQAIQRSRREDPPGSHVANKDAHDRSAHGEEHGGRADELVGTPRREVVKSPRVVAGFGQAQRKAQDVQLADARDGTNSCTDGTPHDEEHSKHHTCANMLDYLQSRHLQ